MDEYGRSPFDRLDASAKKKRSRTLRGPRPKTQWGPSSHGDGDGRGKMYNLNQTISRDSFTRTKTEDGRSHVIHSNGFGRAESGQCEPSKNPILAPDGAGNEKKVRKVKLKVGGVTRTIQTKSISNEASAGGSSSKGSRSSETPSARVRSVQVRQANHGKEDLCNVSTKGSTEKMDKSDLVRKSKRVPKKRVFDEEDDDEIRYLEKLKTSKVSLYYDEEPDNKSIGKQENFEGKDGKKHITEYEDEEELLSGGGPETKKQKRDMNLTTRQRALLTGKDVSVGSQADFYDGLLPPAPRKEKEKLTEVEQQLKRAQAAERRRMQNQKANEESQAEAIRKILGQDSSRKKREEQKKKRIELAQIASQTLGANTIRWVMGPTGTVVTFPQEMGLPQIFESQLSNYPPPREKCAGPTCANPYKYRDSKSQLPLCSLQCYKAIREVKHAEVI